MKLSDRQEFEDFCAAATDAQVFGIIEKESEFAEVDEYRAECLHIAETERDRRGLL